MKDELYTNLVKLPKRHKTSIVILILLFIYGVVGSYFIMGFNWIDSIYYAIITMATVGYGDYTPHTGLQKIFAVTLAFAGVTLLAYVFNIILTNFQERMDEYSKGVRKMRKIKHMDDYYILCGYGRVGKVVLEELQQRNQNVIIIDKDEDICGNIKESKNVIVLNKDAIENDYITTLVNEKCKSVILSTGSDVTNLFIVLTIRETNPDAWIVTRASKLENISKLRKAGANKIVSPEIIGGHDLYFESTRPHLLKITVKHTSDEIFDEFEIIANHGCTLENIEYHLPGIETPLTRQIKIMELADGMKYQNYLKTHDDQKQAIDNLYKATNNIHSHFISGPDKATFDKLTKELEEIEEIIGIDLTDKEIAEITKKEIKA